MGLGLGGFPLHLSPVLPLPARASSPLQRAHPGPPDLVSCDHTDQTGPTYPRMSPYRGLTCSPPQIAAACFLLIREIIGSLHALLLLDELGISCTWT